MLSIIYSCNLNTQQKSKLTQQGATFIVLNISYSFKLFVAVEPGTHAMNNLQL